MLSSSRQALRSAAGPQALAAATRGIGAQGVPEEWGQPRTGGTQFLGTPDNYMKLLKKRPVSPDLFGVEGTQCAAHTRSGPQERRGAARPFVLETRPGLSNALCFLLASPLRRRALQVPPSRSIVNHEPCDGCRPERR